MRAIADYSHTLTFDSLNVYDTDGNDITNQTVLGFYSQSLPVPEPSVPQMMFAGLLLLGMARRQWGWISGKAVRPDCSVQ